MQGAWRGSMAVPRLAGWFGTCTADCVQVRPGDRRSDTAGQFWTICRHAIYEGGQLLLANRAGKRAGIAYTELSSLEGMRDAIQATNTLEAENRRLRKACDFYKAQCFRDARYGMVVNELFDY